MQLMPSGTFISFNSKVILAFMHESLHQQPFLAKHVANTGAWIVISREMNLV